MFVPGVDWNILTTAQMIYSCYSHLQSCHSFTRRCFWLLDGNTKHCIVQYLDVPKKSPERAESESPQHAPNEVKPEYSFPSRQFVSPPSMYANNSNGSHMGIVNNNHDNINSSSNNNNNNNHATVQGTNASTAINNTLNPPPQPYNGTYAHNPQYTPGTMQSVVNNSQTSLGESSQPMPSYTQSYPMPTYASPHQSAQHTPVQLTPHTSVVSSVVSSPVDAHPVQQTIPQSWPMDTNSVGNRPADEPSTLPHRLSDLSITADQGNPPRQSFGTAMAALLDSSIVDVEGMDSNAMDVVRQRSSVTAITQTLSEAANQPDKPVAHPLSHSMDLHHENQSNHGNDISRGKLHDSRTSIERISDRLNIPNISGPSVSEPSFGWVAFHMKFDPFNFINVFMTMYMHVCIYISLYIYLLLCHFVFVLLLLLFCYCCCFCIWFCLQICTRVHTNFDFHAFPFCSVFQQTHSWTFDSIVKQRHRHVCRDICPASG